MAVTSGSIKGNNIGVFIDPDRDANENTVLNQWSTFGPFVPHPSDLETTAFSFFEFLPVAYSSNATITINTEIRNYIQPVVRADRTARKRTGVTSATIQVDGLVALDHSYHDLEQLFGYLAEKKDLVVAWTSNQSDDYAMLARANLMSLQANAPVNGFVDYTATFEIEGDILEMAT